MRFDDLFESKYLKQSDVTPPIQRTIVKITREEIGPEDDRETKGIIYFSTGKPMVLNKVNGLMLLDAFGDIDNWTGKVIEIYADPTVMMKGKRTGGVRVRVPHTNSQDSNGSHWDLAKAYAQCEQAGITRSELIDHLKKSGAKGYNPQRDTAAVQALIATKEQPPEQGFDDELPPPPGNGNDIVPF